MLHMDRIKLTFLLTLFSTASFACSCDWGGNFLLTGLHGELVFKGEVTERTFHLEDGKQFENYEEAKNYRDQKGFNEYYGLGLSITIEIHELIKGTETRRTIRIFNTDGADCREGIWNFEVGKFYIFSTYQIIGTGTRLAGETDQDFAIFACSENWLEYSPETDQVYGWVKGKNRKKKKFFPYSILTEN